MNKIIFDRLKARFNQPIRIHRNIKHIGAANIDNLNKAISSEGVKQATQGHKFLIKAAYFLLTDSPVLYVKKRTWFPKNPFKKLTYGDTFIIPDNPQGIRQQILYQIDKIIKESKIKVQQRSAQSQTATLAKKALKNLKNNIARYR